MNKKDYLFIKSENLAYSSAKEIGNQLEKVLSGVKVIMLPFNIHYIGKTVNINKIDLDDDFQLQKLIDEIEKYRKENRKEKRKVIKKENKKEIL